MISKATTIKTYLLATTLLSVPMVANAQVFEDEVIVTAQKRSENLQDIGVSVSAFTGEQMEALGWDNSMDVAAQTPGLVTTSNTGDAGNIALFSIRGVSQLDFAEGQEAPIAIYRDEAYVSSPGASGVPIYDMERIEVLRGPQGTLYGRNATGGLVHYISNKPTEAFEGSLGFTLGQFGQLGGTMALSGEIAENLQGRFALYYNKDDGYIENRIGPDMRADDTISGRAMLNVDLGTNRSLLLIAQHTDLDTRGGVFNSVASSADVDVSARRYCTTSAADQACRDASFGLYGEQSVIDDNNSENFISFDGIDDGDGDVHAGAFDFIGGVDRTSTNLTAIFKTDFGNGFKLTSVSDYTTSDKDYREDDDSTASAYATYEAGADIDQISQEIRIEQDGDTIDWVAGLYYLDIENDFYGAFKFPTFGRGFVPRFEATNSTTTLSAFGQADFQIAEDLKLTGGLRWTQDDKTIDYQFVEDFFPGSGLLNDGEPHQIDRKDSEFSGKVQLDWQASEDTLFYAGISRGVKGGGFNTDSYGGQAPTLDAIGFDPEILTAYEIGTKNQIGDLRLNASAFYYDYDNFQAFFFEGTTSLMLNSTAKFYGAEAEAIFSPGNGWDILAGISLLDTEVNNADEGVINQNAPLAPDVSANIMIRKAFDLDKSGEITAQISANYVGEQSFNVIQSEITTGGDYSLVNGELTYRPKTANWSIAAFANNITDTEALTYSYDIVGYTIQVFAPPRWLGARFNVDF